MFTVRMLFLTPDQSTEAMLAVVEVAKRPVETQVGTSWLISGRRLTAAWVRFIITTDRLGIDHHVYHNKHQPTNHLQVDSLL